MLTATGFAQDLAPLTGELLEEGVYQEETKGDLGAAIALYQQVIESEQASRPRAAEAQYRLAICYQKQGNTTLAVRSFEALVENYPNQTQWVDAALGHLPKPFEPEFVPWVDGEITTMELRLPTGFVVGYVIYRTELINRDGRDLWRITNRSLAGGESITKVEIDPKTLKPVHGYMYSSQMDLGEISWWFEEDHVRLLYGEDPEEKTVPLSSDVIDNLQAHYLMRQFPIEVGFSTEQTVFVGLSAAAVPIVLSIVALEELETPIGTFECAHVEIEIAGTTQHFWTTTDDSRKLVRFKAGGVEAIVTRSDVVSPGDEQIYRNDSIGFEADLPASWGVFDRSDPEKAAERARIEIRDPGVIGTWSIAATRLDPDDSDRTDLEEAREMVEKQIKGLTKKATDFVLDESSRSETQITDGALVSFLGEAKMGSADVFVKKSVLHSRGVTLVFSLRCLADDLVQQEATFDRIVASARID